MQDVVDQQMEAILYAAQLLRRICLVQGDQLGVVFQLPQKVIAHGIITGQIQRCTAAEIWPHSQNTLPTALASAAW